MLDLLTRQFERSPWIVIRINGPGEPVDGPNDKFGEYEIIVLDRVKDDRVSRPGDDEARSGIEPETIGEPWTDCHDGFRNVHKRQIRSV